MKKIQPSDLISCTLFLFLPIILPFARRAGTPVLVLVGLYAGFILWREARLGEVFKARLRQPVIWLFLAFMGWAAVSLLWTPVPTRGLQAIGSALLLTFCALLIFEFPLSKNAPRFLAIGLSVGSAVIAIDLMTGSQVLHLVHVRPDNFRYNMVVVTFVVLFTALIAHWDKLKPLIWFATGGCVLSAVFASESETAKLALVALPVCFLLARLVGSAYGGAIAMAALIGVWAFAAFGMPFLSQLKSLFPAEFWAQGSADDRLVVWNGFTAFALAGLPWGWGLESTAAPEATYFVSTASEAIRAGILYRLHPHDNILQIAAELGLPGLFIAFALNAKILADVGAFASTRRTYFMGFMAVILLIAATSHGLWQSWWWTAAFIAAYFLCAAETSMTAEKSLRREIERIVGNTFFQAVLAGLLVLLGAKVLRSTLFAPYQDSAFLWQTLALGFVATFVASRSMAFVIRSSVTRAYGYGIPITTVSFSFLAVAISLGRLEYLRLELVLNFISATGLITAVSYWIEARRSFRFHCLSPDSLARFQGLGPISVSLLPPASVLNWRDSDGIIVDFTKALSSGQKRVLALSALNGVRTFDETEVVEKFVSSIPAEHVAQIAKVTTNHLGLYHIIKRMIDLLAAVCLLPFFMVAICLAAIAIKIEDGGAIFFRQDRIGYRGRKFKVWKLRSMKEVTTSAGSLFTLENDHRITRTGLFLRRSRIDELPQIFNVIKGEMSWIGPRPESAPLAEWYGDEIDLYDFRHIVRPGITGWAAVRQGNVGAVDAAKQKLYYDFYYIKNYSFELDLLIAMKTIRILVSGFGAR